MPFEFEQTQDVRSDGEEAELELHAVQLELVPGKAPSPAVEYELPRQVSHAPAWPSIEYVPAAHGVHINTEFKGALVTEVG